jgi:hypothetical protein
MDQNLLVTLGTPFSRMAFHLGAPMETEKDLRTSAFLRAVEPPTIWIYGKDGLREDFAPAFLAKVSRQAKRLNFGF